MRVAEVLLRRLPIYLFTQICLFIYVERPDPHSTLIAQQPLHNQETMDCGWFHIAPSSLAARFLPLCGTIAHEIALTYFVRVYLSTRNKSLVKLID